MKPVFYVLLTAVLSACAFVSKQGADSGGSSAASPKTLTVLLVNDTYRLDNFPALASLRKQYGDALVLHAGDLLFPSLLSTRFDGAQMIDALNHLDGDGTAFDTRLFATFGNHEFDKGKLKHVDMLNQRLRESQFTWVSSNIAFRQDEHGKPMITAPHLVPSALVNIGGIKVGIVGVTLPVKAEYIEDVRPVSEAVREPIAHLRQQGADIVIALTHQTLAQDEAMLRQLGDDGPDMIAGGHEHDRKHVRVGVRSIVKADSDANSVAVIRLTPSSRRRDAHVDFVTLPGTFTEAPVLVERVRHWRDRFDTEACVDMRMPTGCMGEVIGMSREPLIGEELTIRRFETNLGNFVADTARDSFREQGAQIAFINSGSLRLNYNLPAGAVTRRDLETLFAFPMPLELIKISGRQLQAIADHAVSDWTGNGHWLQVSGFAFRHEGGVAKDVSLMTAAGVIPVLPDDQILAVTNRYLLDPALGDQDGFRMLGLVHAVTAPGTSVDLKARVMARLRGAGEAGVAPRVEGRICQPGSPCLLPSPPRNGQGVQIPLSP